MYRDPDEVDNKQSAIKIDPTASARSAIRRQRTVRYSPSTRLPSAPAISSTTYRPFTVSGRTRTPDRQSLLEDIRRRENALDNLSRNAARSETTVRASHQGNASVRSEGVAPSRITQWHRPENGHAPIQHPFISEHTSDRITLTRDNTVPDPPLLPYTRSMDHIDRLSEEFLHESNRPPTPPYTTSHTHEDSPIRQSTPPVGTASLTPRFAPAHRFTGEVEEESIVAGQSLVTRQESLAILAERIPSPDEALNEEDRAFLSLFASHLASMRARSPETLTTPYLTAEATYLRSVEERLNLVSVSGIAETTSNSIDDLLSLRRMAPDHGHEARSEVVSRRYRRSQGRRPRHDNTDGLGDRQRSFSPDDEDWETMLTTITPDERVPSAHSSFTTATATSQSSNSMVSSYGTPVTVPSTHAGTEACPAENSDSSEENLANVYEESLDDATERLLSLERATERHRQATSRLDGYESRLADLARHPTRHAHQARLDEFARGVYQHRARSEELNGHLQRLESELQRLNRDLAEDRISDRQRPEERL